MTSAFYFFSNSYTRGCGYNIITTDPRNLQPSEYSPQEEVK